MEKIKEKPPIINVSEPASVPRLVLRLVEGTGDFTTREIHLESQAWTYAESTNGMEYLLSRVHDLKQTKKGKD